jgi:hypothetical protein
MPAQNGYDRELVFEEAECAARRYGRATLELDRHAMLISCRHRTESASARDAGNRFQRCHSTSATVTCARAARATPSVELLLTVGN